MSNNRADLSGDQQMNYFLAWFNTWSELQRSDFVPVLGGKMSGMKSSSSEINGSLSDSFKSMDCASDRPPSLFSCQVKLFRDWFSGWSDDQKNYLVMRLRDLDAGFFAAYEEFLRDPEGFRSPKDFFEPGIPPDLIRTPTVMAKPRTNGDCQNTKDVRPEDEADEDGKAPLKASSPGGLTPISEDL